MGRKRKDINEVKISKTIRVTPKTWEKIRQEQKILKHKYLVTTIEHIVTTYFKK